MDPAGNQPSTSGVSATSSFDVHFKRAKTIYGESPTRPQDDDPAMLRFLRRANLNAVQPFPEGYMENLHEWTSNIPQLQIPDIPQFAMEMVNFLDHENPNLEAVRSIRPPSGSLGVLAVDFESHRNLSYDGYICVASVASPSTILVSDCLRESRAFTLSWLPKMLTGKRVLKVVCDSENHIFRLQRNWSCFGNGFVDLNDMFRIWKRTFPETCFLKCKTALILRMRERKRPATEETCSNYFQQLQTPGLEFLINVFFNNEKTQKDPAAQYADWSHRPLHDDLINYTGSDSYFILKIFYCLYAIIGHVGLQAAAKDTINKLVDRLALPHYPAVRQSAEDQWVIEQVMDWRDYLAVNLDYHPEEVLRAGLIPRLAQRITGANAGEDSEAIAAILEEFRVPDRFLQAARLLVAYLDQSGASRVRMRQVICHRCNTVGHVAKFCFKEPTKEERKAFMSRDENRQKAAEQNRRRRLKYCLKNGFDPETYTCPWESLPGVPNRH